MNRGMEMTETVYHFSARTQTVRSTTSFAASNSTLNSSPGSSRRSRLYQSACTPSTCAWTLDPSAFRISSVGSHALLEVTDLHHERLRRRPSPEDRQGKAPLDEAWPSVSVAERRVQIPTPEGKVREAIRNEPCNWRKEQCEKEQTLSDEPRREHPPPTKVVDVRDESHVDRGDQDQCGKRRNHCPRQGCSRDQRRRGSPAPSAGCRALPTGLLGRPSR